MRPRTYADACACSLCEDCGRHRPGCPSDIADARNKVLGPLRELNRKAVCGFAHSDLLYVADVLARAAKAEDPQ